MIIFGFGELGAFVTRNFLIGNVCPSSSSSSSSSRARFLPAAFLGAALLAATLATAADFDDPGTIARCCLMLVIEFVLASPCVGVACDDDDDVVVGIRRLGNSTLVAASVITLELVCRSHGNIKSEKPTGVRSGFWFIFPTLCAGTACCDSPCCCCGCRRVSDISFGSLGRLHLHFRRLPLLRLPLVLVWDDAHTSLPFLRLVMPRS